MYLAGILLLCATVLFAGFPEVSDADYRFLSTPLYDGDWIETDDAWFGLFETDSGFDLTGVELEFSRSTAPLDEGERPHPVVVELVDEPNWPLIIISTSKMKFIEGAVNTMYYGNQLLSPGTSMMLEASGIRDALLTATEDGVFLTSDEVCQTLSDTYQGDEFSDQCVEVVWAGDLDRDGKVDLILNDVDNGYLRFRWNLFLSSEAGSDTLVEKVASFCDVYY